MNDRAKSATAMRCRRPGAQAGAILFFTLIALVAMTLAALAMVRSVDTSNLVAGNVALKQGAIQEADRIINTAFACLDSGGELLPLGLESTVATCNYYAFLQPDRLAPFGVPDLLEVTPGVLDPVTQNTSSYVIERMCTDPTPFPPLPSITGLTTTGAWNEPTCIASPFGKAMSYTDRGKPALTPTQGLYRISVMVRGPRNVVSYSQMVMNAGL